MPLLNRRQFPPGGFVFFEPKTGWQSSPGFTFEQTVDEIIKHRRANPRFSAQWATDPETVSQELDEFTCVRIAQDANYCSPGIPNFLPGSTPSPQWPNRGSGVAAGVSKAVGGIGLFLDLFGSGGKPVSQELATARAAVCANCPQNHGKWVDVFTAPVAETLRKQMAIAADMNLVTPHDDKLEVCRACWCHMKTKVWVDLAHIVKHLKPESRAELDPRCWIPKEEHETDSPP